MNRVEAVRDYINNLMLEMSESKERSGTYAHLYGVAQMCAMLALKRKQDVELAMIAGMLHDIATYRTGDSYQHAERGAKMAQGILEGLGVFDSIEIDMICRAIARHSDKGTKHEAFEEVLIDADVLQHVLYSPLSEPMPHEKVRYEYLKKELGVC